MDPSGYDAGKKIRGTLRHIGVDTLGLMLNLVVHPAAVQDRDGGRRQGIRAMADRNREMLRPASLSGAAKAMDCRADVRVDGPQQTAVEG